MTFKEIKDKFFIPIAVAIILSLVMGIPTAIIYFNNMDNAIKQLTKSNEDFGFTIKLLKGSVDSLKLDLDTTAEKRFDNIEKDVDKLNYKVFGYK